MDKIEQVKEILEFEFNWSRSVPITDPKGHAETIAEQIDALYLEWIRSHREQIESYLIITFGKYYDAKTKRNFYFEADQIINKLVSELK